MATDRKLKVDIDLDDDGLLDAVKATEKGLSEIATQWAKDLESSVSDAMTSAIRSSLNDGTSRALWEDLIKAPLQDLQTEMVSLIKDGREEEAALLFRQVKEQAQAQKDLADARTSALEELRKKESRAIEEQIDQLRSGVSDIGSALMGGDVASFINMLKSQGQGLRDRGLAKQGLAKEREFEDPKGAKKSMAMGETLAKLGTGVAAFASVAGVLMTVIKMFAELDGKVKEMNQTLLSTAGSADLGLTPAQILSGGLAKELETVRDETTAVNDNFMKFRATAKEQQEILSQFNQTGFTYARIRKEIESTTDAVESYSDVTSLALTYSRTLGISTSESAQTLAQFALDTGDTLENVAQQLSVITREAQNAGFATKRFFSTISEATSGMAFYGVRVEETARLLKSFDSILGEQVGADVFKQMVNQFKDKGAQDRLRELILKDQEFAQDQFAKAFERQLTAITRDFGGQGGPLAGLNIKELLGQDELSLTQQLKSLGLKPEQISRLLGARQVGKAATGDLGSMVRAMASAGQGFDVALAAQAGPVFGGKRIDEVLRSLADGGAGAAELAALENVTGKSLDELEKLARLFTGAEADLQTLRTISAKLTRNEVLSEEDLKAQKRIEKELDLYVDRQTGAIRKGFRDANGLLVRENAVAIRDAMDVVTATPTEGEATLAEALSKDQQIASEIAQNTTEISKILDQTVASILNDIYDVVISVADWLFRDDRGKQRELALKEEERKRREDLQETAKVARQEFQVAQRELEDARGRGETEQIQQLERQTQHLKKQADDAAVAVERQEAVKTTLENLSSDMTSGKGAGAGVIVDALERQGHRLFAGPEAKDAFLSALDEALPRYAEVTTGGVSGYLEGGFQTMKADFDSLINGPSGWGDTLRQNLKSNNELLSKVAGGETTIEAAIAAGEAAANVVTENMGTFEWLTTNSGNIATQQGEAFSSAAAAVLAQNLKSDQQQKQEQQELINAVKEVKDSLSTMQAPWFQAAMNLFGAKHARDLVIPAGGKPIITDHQDTITASRPGGPIDKASRGNRGGGNLTVNINGGNQTEVYRTMKRVIKELGWP